MGPGEEDIVAERSGLLSKEIASRIHLPLLFTVLIQTDELALIGYKEPILIRHGLGKTKVLEKAERALPELIAIEPGDAVEATAYARDIESSFFHKWSSE